VIMCFHDFLLIMHVYVKGLRFERNDLYDLFFLMLLCIEYELPIDFMR